MNYHIRIEDMLDERFAANTPEEALLYVKQEAARRAPFLLRGLIRNMSEKDFMAQAVKQANQKSGLNDAAPNSAQEFVDWALHRGYLTVEP